MLLEHASRVSCLERLVSPWTSDLLEMTTSPSVGGIGIPNGIESRLFCTILSIASSYLIKFWHILVIFSESFLLGLSSHSCTEMIVFTIFESSALVF